VFEKRRNLMSLQSIPGLRRRATRTKNIKPASISNPDGAIPRCQNRIDSVHAKSFVCGKAAHSKVTEAIEALRCSHPEGAFMVLIKLDYEVTRQTVCCSIMIDVSTVNSVDTLVAGPNPQVLLVIFQERCDFHVLTIQLGRDK